MSLVAFELAYFVPLFPPGSLSSSKLLEIRDSNIDGAGKGLFVKQGGTIKPGQ